MSRLEADLPLYSFLADRTTPQQTYLEDGAM